MDGFVDALGRGSDGLLRRLAQRCFAKRSERTPAKWRPAAKPLAWL
jgi:hypothetical protein